MLNEIIIVVPGSRKRSQSWSVISGGEMVGTLSGGDGGWTKLTAFNANIRLAEK